MTSNQPDTVTSPPNAPEIKRLQNTIAFQNEIIHDMVVAQQAAWIEWRHGKGAEEAME